jgi:hypothetical protein
MYSACSSRASSTPIVVAGEGGLSSSSPPRSSGVAWRPW